MKWHDRPCSVSSKNENFLFLVIALFPLLLDHQRVGRVLVLLV